MPLRAMLYRRPAEPQAIEIVFDRHVYLVRLRRHRLARRYTLRIQTATREVVLTMPPRGSVKDARDFAQNHGAWIAARIGRLPEAAPFAPGTLVPLRGVAHRIVHRRNERGTVWTDIDGHGDPIICVAGDTPHIERRVLDFLRREARKDLDVASRKYAAKINAKIKRITIRDQSSRWGSCSTTGALSFSWRLILAPPFALDYLAAHEVAHLVEMNHSPRFWKLLARICPATARAKAWLDVHGPDLHRYGLPAAENAPPRSRGSIFS